MAEQLALAESRPPAPSAWHWARAKWPGEKIVRVIDLASKHQAFLRIGDETGWLIDGATHFIHVPAESLSLDQERAVIAEYDAAWHDWRPAA